MTQAAEFQDLRFRAGEKSIYKKLNTSPHIKYAFPVNLDKPAQKTSLIIQSILGAAEFPVDSKEIRHRAHYNTEVAIVFQKIRRLVRCLIDVMLLKDDGVASCNALLLARSLGSKVWDDSPLYLKQLEQIGDVSVRKLVNSGISTIEDLETTESSRIEMILARKPPFGIRLLNKVKSFPKVYVSLAAIGKPVCSSRKSERILH